MTRVITLTTDFGISDGYVASMKGVILGINPQAQIVDLTHSIDPQSVREASFILHTTWHSFPDGTIHLAVVDPGVGSHRRSIAVKTPAGYFVTPDNGMLSYVLHEYGAKHTAQGPPAAQDIRKRPLPENCEAISLTRQQYWRLPVSPTFHGRDIFAPVAAHLSLEVPLDELGDRIDSLYTFPVPEPFRDITGNLIGCIIHIDRFGNLITNFRKEDVPARGAAVEIMNQRISGMSQYYAQGSGLMAVIGSSNYLEVSVRDDSASQVLGARVGDAIKLLNPPSNQMVTGPTSR
jgi:S-adenosylmethionine hydrolase